MTTNTSLLPKYIYTPAIQRAIALATNTHEISQKQKRKGKDTPYITHPLTVGLILASAGGSEPLVIAGILHDTIEDSPAEMKVTASQIKKQFGSKVAKLVESVTEKRKDLPWAIRKQKALEHIKDFSHDSLMLKAADTLANVSELLEDYKVEGDKTFLRFNAPKEEILHNYLKTVTAMISGWQKNPLANDLKSLSAELLLLVATH